MDFLNVIVSNNFVRETDKDLLFPKNEKVIFINPRKTDIFDLLVKLGSFPSRGQAKKNWKQCEDLPSGWNEFLVGKKKRHLCIWNPTQ